MKRRWLILIPLLISLLLLTSCSTWDFGSVKIPAILGYIAIFFFVGYVIFQHYNKK